jgi:hypothetical protein
MSLSRHGLDVWRGARVAEGSGLLIQAPPYIASPKHPPKSHPVAKPPLVCPTESHQNKRFFTANGGGNGGFFVCQLGRVKVLLSHA